MKNGQPDSPHEVGYCKPPKESRFKLGSSGNAAGRPKGAQSFGFYLSKALNQRATVSIEGKKMHLTMTEIITRQVMNAAMKGGPKDVELFLSLLYRFDEPSFRPIMKITVIEDEEGCLL